MLEGCPVTGTDAVQIPTPHSQRKLVVRVQESFLSLLPYLLTSLRVRYPGPDKNCAGNKVGKLMLVWENFETLVQARQATHLLSPGLDGVG